MKKYLLFFLTLFWVNSLMAGVVTEKQALQKAQKFMKGKSFVVAGARSMSPDKTAEEPSSFYVFNAENQGGFVIVSGDDRTPEILGYADSGRLDMDNLPSNVKAWLDGYDQQIKSLGNRQVKALTSTPKAAIPALIQTQWDQGAPYNLQCPTVQTDEGEQHCLTGCVATAIAQIMYYYRKAPSSAMPTPAFGSYDVGYWNYDSQSWEVQFTVPALPATTFKWDKMKMTYGDSDGEESRQAVAELMRYVGQSEQMNYGLNGSSASTSLGNWLANFGYNKGAASWLTRNNYTTEEWENIIYNELSNQRPVLYDGRQTKYNSGHAFVCDGYDGNGRFHINWGWGGYCDGHYLLTVLNPTEDEATRQNLTEENTDLSAGWNASQSAYIGIQPAEGNEGKTFTANTQEGAAVTYTITSDKDGNRTCMVGDNKERAIAYDYEGALTIPNEVAYDGKQYTVTTVSLSAFQGGNVSAITLPTTLKSISSLAFVDLWRLKNLEIPASVTSIALAAIVNCGNLESLTVNAGNTVYNSQVIPNAIVETATNKIVVGTSLVTSIPNTIKEIGNSAFRNCSGLKLTIPKEVETIGNFAFAWCRNSVITVERSEPLNVQAETFLECGNVSLRVPAGAKSTYQTAPGWSAFGDNILEGDEGTEFTTKVEDINMKFTITGGNTVKVGSLSGAWDDRAVNRDEVSGKTIAIPETVTNGDKSYNVTAIGANAFNNCSGMNLTLPAAVTSIGEDAFSNCHSINLTIPSAVNTIGDYAFAGCSSGIITVERDEPLDIPEHVFKYASGNGMKLRVPAGAKTKYAGATGWSAFGDNILEGDEGTEFTATVSGLEMTFTVTGSNTAKVGFLTGSWDKQAVTVEEGSEIDKIEIPEKVTYNGHAYTVTEIGANSFRSIQMKSLTLPSTLKTIGTWVIVDNNNITELVIPASVTSIAPQAIINCSNLSSLSVANGNETYDSRDGICAIVETKTNTIIVGTNKVTTIPSSITAIGEYAFRSCYNLNLTIPESVVNIGNYAFAWCSNSVITVPWAEPLTIPENTFEECGLNYVSLRVPAGSKETYKKATGWSAFGDNILEGDEGTEFTATVSGLEMTFTVTGDNTVKVGHLNGSWENRAVNRTVASGKDIEIPTTIEYKGIPYAVTEIGAWAFNNCYNINITIPASVVSIGEQAFSYCYNNSVITVEYTDLSVVSVKENTFDGASENNAILKVPEGTKSLYENATGWNKFSSQNIKEIVKGTSKVVTIETAGTLATKISAEEKFRISELTITGPINGTDVRLIREMAGNDYQGRVSDGILEKLDLSGATIVAGGNKYLETNEIVASSGNSYWLNSEVDYVTRDNEIGELFFTACEKLKELKLPAKVTSIGHGAFAMMRSLRAIELPASLTSINRGNLFSQCGNLTTLTITAGGIYSSPEGSNAIMKGKELVLGIGTTIIPDDTETIGEGAFDNGGITGKVILPASVKHIGHEAFANCNGLTEVSLPDGLLSIGNMAFVWSGIQKLNVPASVNSIGTQIVAGCHSLETLTVDGQNEKFDSRNNCNAIILSAENKLLHGCKTTVIPTTITSIGEYAITHLYSDVEDVQLVIPTGVTSIGEGAFMYSFYESVKSQITKPFKIDANVFKEISSDAVLHVPTGCKSLYEKTDGWKDTFSQIVEMSDEIVANDVTYEMTEDNKIEVKTAAVNATTGSVSIAQKVVVNEVAVTVTAIAPKAFQNVEAVKSVTIPATVESIGDLAFAGCTNLKEVLCLNPDPVNLSVASARGLLKDGESGGTVSQFDGVDLKGCTLYVLTEAKERYEGAPGWNSFGTIKPFAGMGDVNTDKAIDVSDVVGEVNQILGKASTGFLYGAGDMNADNSIDVSDVVSIVNVILGKTAAARSMERQSAVAETTATDHLSLMAGNEGGLSLVLDNTADYIAAQFDVRLSEGQTLEQVVKGQRARGHQLATAKVADDTYRVLLYTIGDRTFSGQSGEVVSIGVAGEGSVSVENITFITAGESRKKFDDLSNQLTGIGATLNDNGEMINDKAVWHDLQGRKLETAPTTKGVYLKNGKKVVVK